MEKESFNITFEEKFSSALCWLELYSFVPTEFQGQYRKNLREATMQEAIFGEEKKSFEA